MNLGLAIKAIRKAKNMLQKEVYLELGITSSAYTYNENRVCLRLKTMRPILKILGVPEAAVLLYAVREEEIPEQYREMFKELKKKIIQ